MEKPEGHQSSTNIESTGVNISPPGIQEQQI
jgi:hypothetical protein